MAKNKGLHTVLWVAAGAAAVLAAKWAWDARKLAAATAAVSQPAKGAPAHAATDRLGANLGALEQILASGASIVSAFKGAGKPTTPSELASPSASYWV